MRTIKEIRACVDAYGGEGISQEEAMALLDVVERVAESEPVGEDAYFSVCHVCGGGYHLASDHKEQHRSDCAWLAAKKMVGGG